MLKITIFAICLTLAHATAKDCAEGCEKYNMICNIETDVCMCRSGYMGSRCEIDCDLTLNGQSSIDVQEQHYGEHVNCEWRNNPNMITTVRVRRFDVEKDTSCVYDYVSIQGVHYCGRKATNDMPKTFTLRGRDSIKFITDRSVSKSGFKFELNYERVGGPIRTTTLNSDPNAEDTPVPECPLKVVRGKPRFYMLGGLVRPCAPGTVFSLFHCTCIHE